MGPGLHPQYTRADFGQEAVGGPSNSTSTTQRRRTHNVSMRTEPNDVQEPNDEEERAQLPQMNTETLMNGSTVKNHILLKTVFGYSATQNFVPIMVLGLSTSSSSSFPSSTSRTLSRQEIDHLSFSSSSSTSPAMTVSSDSETGAREDLCGIESFPVSVSSEHVERKERRDA